MRGFLLGLILGVLALPIAAWGWLHYGNPPVAVTDPRFPMEQQIANVPLHARIDREMPAHAAMDASPANLLIGAAVYREQCASCHGQYGRPSSYGPHMFPGAPQLWAPNRHNGVGVSDDPAGETYWKVKNGIRLSGMPSYARILNEAQMWQVSVLLANADKPLPADVLSILKQPLLDQSRIQVQAASSENSTQSLPGATIIPVQPPPQN